MFSLAPSVSGWMPSFGEAAASAEGARQVELERQSEWEMADREQRLHRLELEGQLSLQSTKGLADAKTIKCLEAENEAKQAAIIALEAQLKAVRVDHEQLRAAAERKQQQQEQQISALKKHLIKQGRDMKKQNKIHELDHQHLEQEFHQLLSLKSQLELAHAQEVQAMQNSREKLRSEVKELSLMLQDEKSRAQGQLDELLRKLNEQEETSKAQVLQMQQQLCTISEAAAKDHEALRRQLGEQLQGAERKLEGALEKLDRAEQQLQRQDEQAAAGEQQLRQLQAQLREQVAQAEDEKREAQRQQLHLEQEAQQFQARADQAKSTIEGLEAQLESKAKLHEEEVQGLHRKTADLLLSFLEGPSGNQNSAAGQAATSQLQSRVVQLLDKLYVNEISEEQAAQELAQLKPEQGRAQEARQKLNTDGSAPEAWAFGVKEAALGNSSLLTWTGQPSFVLADSAKISRLINRASQIRQEQLACGQGAAPAQQQQQHLQHLGAGGLASPSLKARRYPWDASQAPAAPTASGSRTEPIGAATGGSDRQLDNSTPSALVPQGAPPKTSSAAPHGVGPAPIIVHGSSLGHLSAGKQDGAHPNGNGLGLSNILSSLSAAAAPALGKLTASAAPGADRWLGGGQGKPSIVKGAASHSQGLAKGGVLDVRGQRDQELLQGAGSRDTLALSRGA